MMSVSGLHRSTCRGREKEEGRLKIFLYIRTYFPYNASRKEQEIQIDAYSCLCASPAAGRNQKGDPK
ncbi:hypothetical protein HMPREF7545_0283 [Selenomonas noxia ATCC 43541]|nr:hypothetical protein HMPREF7545_0283 [Selenomonas noxia ATCC 43541]